MLDPQHLAIEDLEELSNLPSQSSWLSTISLNNGSIGSISWQFLRPEAEISLWMSGLLLHLLKLGSLASTFVCFCRNHAVARYFGPWNFGHLRFISLGCIRYCRIDSMCPTGEAFPLVLPAPFSAIAGESCQHAKEWCFLSQGQW